MPPHSNEKHNVSMHDNLKFASFTSVFLGVHLASIVFLQYHLGGIGIPCFPLLAPVKKAMFLELVPPVPKLYCI